MAQPIRFSVPAPDPRAVLRDRVDRAPEEHAQAILAAYELLQAASVLSKPVYRYTIQVRRLYFRDFVVGQIG